MMLHIQILAVHELQGHALPRRAQRSIIDRRNPKLAGNIDRPCMTMAVQSWWHIYGTLAFGRATSWPI